MNNYLPNALTPIHAGDNVEVDLLLVDNGNMPGPKVLLGTLQNVQVDPFLAVRLLRNGRITIIPWHAIAAIRPALTPHPAEQE